MRLAREIVSQYHDHDAAVAVGRGIDKNIPTKRSA